MRRSRSALSLRSPVAVKLGRDRAYLGCMPNAPTLVAAIDSLRAQGYDADFRVTSDGQLVCDVCGHAVPPGAAVVESTDRFEGPSNPDDQAILFGLRCDDCGVRGVLVTAYGPTATAEEATVLTALSDPQ